MRVFPQPYALCSENTQWLFVTTRFSITPLRPLVFCTSQRPIGDVPAIAGVGAHDRMAVLVRVLARGPDAAAGGMRFARLSTAEGGKGVTLTLCLSRTFAVGNPQTLDQGRKAMT